MKFQNTDIYLLLGFELRRFPKRFPTSFVSEILISNVASVRYAEY